MKRARVLIADSHEIARLGIRALLESHPEYEVCGEAVDGSDLISQVSVLCPDVVVTELIMENVNGLDAARAILRLKPGQKILAFTYCDSEQLAQEALQSGIRGLLLKSDDAKDFYTALGTIRNGGLYFSDRMSGVLLRGFLRGSGAVCSDPRYSRILTSREIDIVKQIVSGRSSREIADFFSVSVNTIESHRTNIMRKLDVHSVAELVVYTVRNNVISIKRPPAAVATAPNGIQRVFDRNHIELAQDEMYKRSLVDASVPGRRLSPLSVRKLAPLEGTKALLSRSRGLLSAEGRQKVG